MITKFNSLWPYRKELIVKENNYWQKLSVPVMVFDPDADSSKYLKDKNEYYYQISRLSKTKSKLTDSLEEHSVGFEVGCFLYPDTDEFYYHIIHCTKYCMHCGTKTWNISKELNIPYSLDDEILEHANANRKCLEEFILNKIGIKNFNELTDEHFDNLTQMK